MCWPQELGWLYDNLAASQSHVEVGSYCGRSLWASCGGMRPLSRVWAVEPFQLGACPGLVVPGDDWVREVLDSTCIALHQARGGAANRITLDLLEMGSLEAARHLRPYIGEGLDSVYIDAAHTYAECLGDILAWRALVKPGGLVCGHDYWPADAGVMDAVSEAFEGRAEVMPKGRIWFARL